MTAMGTNASFQAGDRIIFSGQFIGILTSEVSAGHWLVDWEDEADTKDTSFPAVRMVFANGGRGSAQRGRHKYEVVEAEPYTFHCTDRNPDYCACATDEGHDCVLCGEGTDGYTTLNITRQVNPFIDPGEPDQEWETITRHKYCDEAKEEEPHE